MLKHEVTAGELYDNYELDYILPSFVSVSTYLCVPDSTALNLKGNQNSQEMLRWVQSFQSLLFLLVLKLLVLTFVELS